MSKSIDHCLSANIYYTTVDKETKVKSPTIGYFKATINMAFTTADDFALQFRVIKPHIKNSIDTCHRNQHIIMLWAKTQLTVKSMTCNDYIHLIINGSGRKLKSYGAFFESPFDCVKDIKQVWTLPFNQSGLSLRH